MIDPAGLALLQERVRQDSRSLLQYASEAFPWTTPENQPYADAVCVLAQEEAAAVNHLARFLLRQHAPPSAPASYPSAFTTLNFVALDHLLPQLVAEQRKVAAELESRVVYVPKGETRSLLEAYMQLKRRHLQAMEELAKLRQPSVVT